MRDPEKTAWIGLAIIACLVLFGGGLFGCGGSHKPTRSTIVPACAPPAHAGCSVKPPSSTLRGTPPRQGTRVVPDASEYQGCPRWTGPVIFKVYEGGYGQDHSALCNARRVHAVHVWAGVYAFLRPANCAGQGYATAQIVKQIGGVKGPVVADAEVSLPGGCVQDFLAAVRKYLGGPVDIYTAPGTWPGGHLSAPLWVATYGPRPGCVEGVCAHVAWQFSSTAHCGPIVGDCSIDSGITQQVRENRHAKLYADYRLRLQLRHLLSKYSCRTHPLRKRTKVCHYWRKRGNVVNAEIVRFHHEGVY